MGIDISTLKKGNKLKPTEVSELQANAGFIPNTPYPYSGYPGVSGETVMLSIGQGGGLFFDTDKLEAA